MIEIEFWFNVGHFSNEYLFLGFLVHGLEAEEELLTNAKILLPPAKVMMASVPRNITNDPLFPIIITMAPISFCLQEISTGL